MTIEQIRVGSDNFSYVIYSDKTKEAALVDPGFDASKGLDFINNHKLKLLYIINTHKHSDHTADNQRVKSECGSEILAPKDDGEELLLGEVRLKFLLTPGHTPEGLCIVVDDEALLTGDTLFIGDCGRTDLPGGSDAQMYETLQRLKTLPDHLKVYPGHDYGPKPFDTLGNQKQTNKTLLANNLEEFSRIP